MGVDWVKVLDVKGYGLLDIYKVCVIYVDGFCGGIYMSFVGFDVDKKV